MTTGSFGEIFEKERKRKALGNLYRYKQDTCEGLVPRPYRRKGDGVLQWWFEEDCVQAKDGGKKPIIELCIEVLGGIYCTQFFKSKGIDWKSVIRDKNKYFSVRNELLQIALTRLKTKTRKEGVLYPETTGGEVL